MTAPVVAAVGPDRLDDLAGVHRAAFPLSALSALGPEAVRRYYRWQLDERHDAIVLGAFDGERLVGFCVGGVFRGALSGFVRTNRWFLVRAVMTRPWLVGRAAFRAWAGRAVRIAAAGPARPIRSPAPAPATASTPSFGVLAIAVDPAWRRRGTGRALLAAAEAEASARGFERMHLTVAAANEAAVRLYAACGWTTAGGDRMEKALGAARPAER